MEPIDRTDVLNRATGPVDKLVIQLRAYVDPDDKPHDDYPSDPVKPSEFSLIFDTETTTDPSQRLRFGTFQLRARGHLVERGIFYNEVASMVPASDREVLAKIIGQEEPSDAGEKLLLFTRIEFVKYFFKWARADATIIGFNLPFDLSRLAGSYLRVIMDEVFGRNCFVASNVWQKRYSRENREAIGDVHEYIFVYAKSVEKFKGIRNKIPLDEAQAKIYRNPDNAKESDPAKRWRGLPMTAQGYRPNQMYTITSQTGVSHVPPEGRCWSMIEPEFEKLKAAGRIYWGKDGSAQPSVIRYLSEVEGLVPWTWWPHTEVGHTDESKKECNLIFGADVSFGTPKPERLIQRILHIATKPGDLVLDSVLGSGTTAAVAQKMGRRYIGIEMGDHAVTHCQPRLKKVVDGEQGGISKSVNWTGGGGFRFYRLGAPVFDPLGHISPNIRFIVLAAHIWFSETGVPWNATRATPYLGTHEGHAFALLYNGILGEKSISGGNVLTRGTLALIRKRLPDFGGPITIYGERSALGEASLKRLNIIFKQTPYDVKARA